MNTKYQYFFKINFTILRLSHIDKNYDERLLILIIVS